MQNKIFDEKTATANYKDTVVDFGFAANHLKMCTKTADVEFSYNGIDTHGKLLTTDGLVDFHGANVDKVYLKGTGAVVRVFAWE